MHAPDNIVPIGTKRSASGRAATESVIAELASLGDKFIPPLLKALFDKADTSLFEMADKAENHTQQAHYFDTMRELRLVRSDIESRFRQEFNRGFESVLRNEARPAASQAESFDMESLSLVEEDNLEESLAIRGMVDKLKNLQGSQLEALQQRFAHLLNRPDDENLRYPISPEAICESFQNALSVMEAELPIRLVIYKLFDLNVIAKLGPFYEAANELLIHAGILPELPKAWQKPAISASPAAPAASGQSAIATEQGTAVGSDSDGSLLAALQSLLGTPSAAGIIPIQPGVQLSPGTGISQVDPQQLVAGLTGLQQNASLGNGGAIDGASLKNMLASTLQGDGEQGIVGFQQRESLLIDVVAMLFDYILEDETIPDIARAQIARLQIPMVKAALIDESFLSKKHHPARQLLNRLAQVSAGLDNQLEEESPHLAEINRIVNTITDEFEHDISLFERELQSLEEFLDEQARKEQQVNEIITDAKSRQEREELLRARVDELIRIKLAMGEGEIAEPIRQIVQTSWRKVLLHTGREHGIDSELWQERSELISDLIESVQPKEEKEARRALLQAIPGIVSVIRRGLSEAGFSQEAITQTLKVIEPLHMAIIAPGTPGGDTTDEALKQRAIENAINDMQKEMEQLDEMLGQIDGSLLDPEPIGEAIHEAIPEDLIEDIVLSTEEPVTPDDLPDDEFITTIRDMEIGQMVILHDKDNNPVRCKLSWKSELLGEYVFTNWRHKVVAERTLHGLAGELYQGRLQLLDQAPILERAMTKVLGALRQPREEENLPDGLPA